MSENEIAAVIVDAAYKVYRKLGPGLLESAYAAVLVAELRRRGVEVAHQKALPLVYEGMKLEIGYRIDLLVEDRVIVELKAVEETAPVHRKQLLTYLRLADKRLGLLINFGAPSFRLAVTRLVNGLSD